MYLFVLHFLLKYNNVSDMRYLLWRNRRLVTVCRAAIVVISAFPQALKVVISTLRTVLYTFDVLIVAVVVTRLVFSGETHRENKAAEESNHGGLHLC